jgi:GNAT superfamily N-acetyltransferase
MPDLHRLDERDYDELLALWLSTGLDSVRPSGRDSREAFARQLAAGQVVLGLREAGRLVASVVITNDTRKGWINRLVVAPDRQRRGLGARLIHEAEAELRRLGLSLSAALIEDYNEASLALFQKEGYVLDRGVLYVSKRDSPES